MMDELIAYLEKVYELKVEDLAAEEFDRGALVGQHQMLDLIRQINEYGYPVEQEIDE